MGTIICESKHIYPYTFILTSKTKHLHTYDRWFVFHLEKNSWNYRHSQKFLTKITHLSKSALSTLTQIEFFKTKIHKSANG